MVKKGAAEVLPKDTSMVFDPETQLRNASVSEIRNLLEKEVKSGAISMVRSVIAGVNDGQYVGMKYLFEMVGIYPSSSSEDHVHGEESLASILLRHLGVPESLLSQDAVTKDSAQGGDREKDHTVE